MTLGIYNLLQCNLLITVKFLQDLGEAILTKRPTCAVMIKRHDGFISRYDKSFEEVKSLSF